MGRTLDQAIAALPQSRRARIEARGEALRQEVASLTALRRLAGKAQVENAARLKVKQPTVSRIEKQTDMYLSTLRRYVEAVGGRLEVTVRLPAHPPLRLERLGGLGGDAPAAAPRPSVRRRPRKAVARAG